VASTGTTQRFGNKATLQDKEDAKHDPIQYAGIIGEAFWRDAYGTIQSWDDGQGNRLKNVRGVFTAVGEGILLDLIGEVTEQVDGLTWINSFNSNSFRDNCKIAIGRACQMWADDQWERYLIVTEYGITQQEERP
jgi:hypothetical protein